MSKTREKGVTVKEFITGGHVDISKCNGCYYLSSRCQNSYYSSTVFIKDSGRLHNSDAIMSTMASQITSLTIFTQPLIQAQIKENTKAPRHWPLWGEFIGDRWVPRTKGQ